MMINFFEMEDLINPLIHGCDEHDGMEQGLGRKRYNQKMIINGNASTIINYLLQCFLFSFTDINDSMNGT